MPGRSGHLDRKSFDGWRAQSSLEGEGGITKWETGMGSPKSKKEAQTGKKKHTII